MTQTVVDSLLRACVLSVLAVGLTMTFGMVRFPNVANLEFATLGGYGTILVQTLTGAPLAVCVLAAMALTGLLAMASYRFLLRRLISRSPAIALIGSFALSIALRALLQAVAGPDPLSLDLPLERGIDLGGVLVTPSQLVLVGISVVLLAALLLALRYSPLGRSIRAVSANPDLASAAGINSGRIVGIGWFIAGALGALAGVFVTVDTQASVNMGFELLLPVFAVAVLGGLGSPGGAVLAAILLALLENLALKIDFGHLAGGGSYFVPVGYQAAIGFVLLVLMLLFRPRGLFGREARRG